MEKIINKLCMSFLGLTLILCTADLQGDGENWVKGMNDKSFNTVVGILPYYRDANGHVYALLGRYRDPRFPEVYTSDYDTMQTYYSAPIEFAEDETVQQTLLNKVAEIFGTDLKQKVVVNYSLNTFKKQYDLYLVEIASINDGYGKMNFYDYSLSFIPGFKRGLYPPKRLQYFDIDLSLKVESPDLKTSIAFLNDAELLAEFIFNGQKKNAARGFADCLKEVISNMNTYFPVPVAPEPEPSNPEPAPAPAEKNPVADSLTTFADALNQLALQIK